MPKRGAGTHVDDKGYLRISAGPLRGVRVHRLVAEAKLGRKLRKDEDVHHKDGNKLNCAPSNLKVMDHTEHGCVSAKQHWYVKNVVDPRLKREWDEYHDEGTRRA